MYGSVSELADVVERRMDDWTWREEFSSKLELLTDSVQAAGEQGELAANLTNFSFIRSFSKKQISLVFLDFKNPLVRLNTVLMTV